MKSFATLFLISVIGVFIEDARCQWSPNLGSVVERIIGLFNPQSNAALPPSPLPRGGDLAPYNSLSPRAALSEFPNHPVNLQRVAELAKSVGLSGLEIQQLLTSGYTGSAPAQQSQAVLPAFVQALIPTTTATTTTTTTAAPLYANINFQQQLDRARAQAYGRLSPEVVKEVQALATKQLLKNLESASAEQVNALRTAAGRLAAGDQTPQAPSMTVLVASQTLPSGEVVPIATIPVGEQQSMILPNLGLNNVANDRLKALVDSFGGQINAHQQASIVQSALNNRRPTQATQTQTSKTQHSSKMSREEQQRLLNEFHRTLNIGQRRTLAFRPRSSSPVFQIATDSRTDKILTPNTAVFSKKLQQIRSTLRKQGKKGLSSLSREERRKLVQEYHKYLQAKRALMGATSSQLIMPPKIRQEPSRKPRIPLGMLLAQQNARQIARDRVGSWRSSLLNRKLNELASLGTQNWRGSASNLLAGRTHTAFIQDGTVLGEKFSQNLEQETGRAQQEKGNRLVPDSIEAGVEKVDQKDPQPTLQETLLPLLDIGGLALTANLNRDNPNFDISKGLQQTLGRLASYTSNERLKRKYTEASKHLDQYLSSGYPLGPEGVRAYANEQGFWNPPIESQPQEIQYAFASDNNKASLEQSKLPLEVHQRDYASLVPENAVPQKAAQKGIEDLERQIQTLNRLLERKKAAAQRPSYPKVNRSRAKYIPPVFSRPKVPRLFPNGFFGERNRRYLSPSQPLPEQVPQNGTSGNDDRIDITLFKLPFGIGDVATGLG